MQNQLSQSAALVVCAFIASATTAMAQDPPWDAKITAYSWAAGASGSIQAETGGPQLEFEKKFTDVLEELSFATFFAAEARRGRLIFLGDFSYVATSQDGEISPGVTATADVTQTSLSLAAGYRVVDTPDLSFDAFGGVRMWQIKGEINGAGGVSRSITERFADPIIGIRATAQIAPRWSVTGYADVGGFGLNSELTSQAFATVNYQLRDNLSVSAGYRMLFIERNENGFNIDTKMGGLLLGATYAF